MTVFGIWMLLAVMHKVRKSDWTYVHYICKRQTCVSLSNSRNPWIVHDGDGTKCDSSYGGYQHFFFFLFRLCLFLWCFFFVSDDCSMHVKWALGRKCTVHISLKMMCHHCELNCINNNKKKKHHKQNGIMNTRKNQLESHSNIMKMRKKVQQRDEMKKKLVIKWLCQFMCE